MCSTTIRPATTSDVPGLVQLANGVIAEDRWLTRQPGEEFVDRDFLRAIEGADGALYVATIDERVVGLVRLRREADGQMHLGMLVGADDRGQGLGKDLLDAGVAWAKQRGLAELYLVVFTHNVRAIELYRSNGFRQIAVQPRICTRRNGEVWDSLVMVRPL